MFVSRAADNMHGCILLEEYSSQSLNYNNTGMCAGSIKSINYLNQ